MSSTQYIGSELDVFAHARNWKAYLRHLVLPYLRGQVLEVGAGIGATTTAFRSPTQSRWIALEPDPQLALRLRAAVSRLDSPVHVIAGTLASVRDEARFDCVLYIDVLEHIENDRDELRQAAARLAPGGRIIVLSPAHQSLFTPFDAAIGHFRRYGRKQLADLTPGGTTLERLQYLDCVGLTLTLGNKMFLRSASPTHAQVQLWDRWCVPLSRRLDVVTRGMIGKSVLAVWRRDRAV